MTSGPSKRFLPRLKCRAVALLAVLSVLSGPFELLLPDVHDGHAFRGLAVATMASPPVSPSNSPDESRMTASADLSEDAALAPGESDSHERQSPRPDHRAHVDHCVHGHLLDLGLMGYADNTALAPRSQIDTQVPRLASVRMAPRLRPPIA